jgi:hypothetical protein
MLANRTRMLGAVLVALVGVLGALGGSGVQALACWRPPVEGVIADRFREPPCRWCPGNRGLEYQVAGDVDVRAAASGTVTFAGDVAGVSYVVIELPTGWRHTYGRLATSRVQVDDRVLAGTIVGQASEEFFFGLRVGDDYRDPEPFLGTWSAPARLVPTDGTAARPTSRQILRCRAAAAAQSADGVAMS